MSPAPRVSIPSSNGDAFFFPPGTGGGDGVPEFGESNAPEGRSRSSSDGAFASGTIGASPRPMTVALTGGGCLLDLPQAQPTPALDLSSPVASPHLSQIDRIAASVLGQPMRIQTHKGVRLPLPDSYF